jgi:hypothetical protein
MEGRYQTPRLPVAKDMETFRPGEVGGKEI